MNFLENVLLTTFSSTAIGDIANSGLSKVRELFFGKAVRLVSQDELPENKDGPKVSQLVSLFEAKAATEAAKAKPSPKQHIIAVVGSATNPLNEEQISKALKVLKLEKDRQNQSIDALVIYGNNVRLHVDPGIVSLNPKKLIINGGWIVNRTSEKPVDRLDEGLLATRKWEGSGFKFIGSSTFVTQHVVKSIDEALKHQTEQRPQSTKKYHSVYVIN